MSQYSPSPQRSWTARKTDTWRSKDSWEIYFHYTDYSLLGHVDRLCHRSINDMSSTGSPRLQVDNYNGTVYQAWLPHAFPLPPMARCLLGRHHHVGDADYSLRIFVNRWTSQTLRKSDAAACDGQAAQVAIRITQSEHRTFFGSTVWAMVAIHLLGGFINTGDSVLVIRDDICGGSAQEGVKDMGSVTSLLVECG